MAQMSAAHASETVKLERKAARVLAVVRCFVGVLRSYQWADASILPRGGVKASSLSLVDHIDSGGIFRQIHGISAGHTLEDRHGSIPVPVSEADDVGGDRERILLLIVIPLLKHLTDCYTELDKLPQTTRQVEDDRGNLTSDNRGKRKTKQSAPPPPGMLSLNDYTNVACLLEFVVSVSLVPCLEFPSLCFPALPLSPEGCSRAEAVEVSTLMSQRRCRALPKSLAGRISRQSLAWGTKTAAESQNLKVGEATSCNIVTRLLEKHNEMARVAISVGKLVLLDRFRPMLLPRHLGDVYLCVFIAERLRWYLMKLDKDVKLPSFSSRENQLLDQAKATQEKIATELSELERALRISSLEFQSSHIASVRMSTVKQVTKSVDPRESALAYRNLLGGGAAMLLAPNRPCTPTWLRIRLGQCLTNIARDDLESVVDVFVASAHGPGGNDGGHLDDEIMTGAAARLARALCARPLGAKTTSDGAANTNPLERSLCRQLIQFLEEDGRRYIAEIKVKNEIGLARPRVSVAMALTLWATISQLAVSTLDECFFGALSKGLFDSQDWENEAPRQSAASIASLMITIPSLLDASTRKKIQSFLLSDHDGFTVLTWILNASTFLTDGDQIVSEVNARSADNAALCKLMNTSLVQMLRFLSCDSNFSDSIISDTLLQAISPRSVDFDPVSAQVKIPHHHQSDPLEELNKMQRRAGVTVEAMKHLPDNSPLPSNLFRRSLGLHFSSISTTDTELGLPGLRNADSKEAASAATVVVALLCEQFQPSALLGGVESGVLQLLGLVIHAASNVMKFMSYTSGAEESSEEILSLTEIILSLLIAMLELGSEKRAKADEDFFQSLQPSLSTISAGHAEHLSPDISMIVTQLAEMSSHASALIAARGVESADPEPDSNADSCKTQLEKSIEKMSKAEEDLRSTQPPIRARGIVSIRHIARSLEPNHHERQTRRPLVVDVGSTMLSTREEASLLVRTLAKLCLESLADDESYVYLAGIQSLVAIGDAFPAEMMPLIGQAVAKGEIYLDVLSGTVQAPVNVSLSPEQRVKATEALIFMIRRRGEGIFLYGRNMMDMMLYGPKDDLVGESSNNVEIQRQTHLYFVNDTDDGKEEDETDERTLRLNTGGPIYSTEENQLIRAGAISVVTELISVLDGTTIASYCCILVQLVNTTLSLETSRPIRRCTAGLARELYSCSLKEVLGGAHSDAPHPSSEVLLAIMSAPDEESKLLQILEQCVAGTSLSPGHMIDPATQSRCKEALEIRDELVSLGVLEVAAMVAASRETSPATLAVRKALAK